MQEGERSTSRIGKVLLRASRSVPRKAAARGPSREVTLLLGGGKDTEVMPLPGGVRIGGARRCCRAAARTGGYAAAGWRQDWWSEGKRRWRRREHRLGRLPWYPAASGWWRCKKA